MIKYNDDYAKGFSLIHLNVRSLSKNISKLNNYLPSLDLKFSIMGLSKTWVKSYNLDLYELTEYRSVHLTRPSKKGGGVSLYIHKSYEYLERSEMTTISEK